VRFTGRFVEGFDHLVELGCVIFGWGQLDKQEAASDGRYLDRLSVADGTALA